MPKKELAKGYTTGTCAQAATRAAMQMLFTGEKVEQVSVELPQGEKLQLDITDIQRKYTDRELPDMVSCAVKKNSGDDPDITNGVLVYSQVRLSETGQIHIDGGIGVGRVTRPGLNQPVGEAAINRVPRQMIRKEVEEACEEVGYTGGIDVEISIPEGARLAKETFNPRLGIEGGLSILGTTGIVNPMSEQALIDTIEVEMKVCLAEKYRYLIIAPGNYGLDFLKEQYPLYECNIKPEFITKDMMVLFVDYLQSRSVGEGAKSIYQRFKKVIRYAIEHDVILKDLTYKNVDYSNKLLKFEQNKTKGHSSASGVVIPLNDGLLSIIGEPPADGNKDVLIFNLPSYESCCKSVKRWVKRSGIDKHISWHCARHSFAVNILNNGANIKTVASLLGHSGLKHTEKCHSKHAVSTSSTLCKPCTNFP